MDTTKVKGYAEQLLVQWGLSEKGWTFVFNAAMSYAGECRYVEKQIRVSKPIAEIETEDFVYETVRHEVAHALTDPRAKAHGQEWKRWAVRVGAQPKATYTSSEVLEAATLKRAKYVLCCDGKVIRPYLRKPNAKTMNTIKERWMPGKKEETLGKLYFEVYNPSKHVQISWDT